MTRRPLFTLAVLLLLWLYSSVLRPVPAVGADAKGGNATVPPEPDRITEMLRQTFGQAVADAVRVDVETIGAGPPMPGGGAPVGRPGGGSPAGGGAAGGAPGAGVRVKLRGELSDDKIRQAVMDAVSDRVQGVRFEDFALEVAGPVRLLATTRLRFNVDYPMVFSADGRWAALVAQEFNDDTFEIWDLTARRRLNRPETHGLTRVKSLGFSGDNALLASGHFNDGLFLWRLPYGDQPVVLRAPDPLVPASVYAVAFSPDGKTLATVSSGGRDEAGLWLWDLSRLREQMPAPDPSGKPVDPGVNLKPRAVLQLAPNADAYYLAFAPDGTTLAVGAKRDREVVLFDLAARGPKGKFQAEGLTLEGLAWSPDGKSLAAGRLTGDAGINVWEVASGRSKTLVPPERQLLRSVAYSKDGKTLATRHSGTGVVLWDLAGGKPWMTINLKRSGDGGAVAFSSDGAVLMDTATNVEAPGMQWWDVSARPGGSGGPAGGYVLPAVTGEPPPRDDYLKAEVVRYVRMQQPAPYSAGLKADVLSDGSIKLYGTVPSARASETIERSVVVQFGGGRFGVPARRVVNELQVTGEEQVRPGPRPDRFPRRPSR